MKVKAAPAGLVAELPAKRRRIGLVSVVIGMQLRRRFGLNKRKGQKRPINMSVLVEAVFRNAPWLSKSRHNAGNQISVA